MKLLRQQSEENTLENELKSGLAGYVYGRGGGFMKVFGLQGNEYIGLAGYDHHSEWLMKHQEETNRDRDGQTVAERKRETDRQR